MARIDHSERQVIRISGLAVDRRQLAGFLFMALAAQFLTAIMLAAAMVEGYNFCGSAISDLGTYTETDLLVNGSLVVLGLMNIAGGYCFYRLHRERWHLAMFAVAGIGEIGTAMFPLDTSDLHGLFALVDFLFFNLEAIGTATQVKGLIRVLAILAGVVGLGYVVLMAIGDAGNPAVFGPIGHGGTERMIVYPVIIWLIAFGGYLLGQSDATLADHDRADCVVASIRREHSILAPAR